MPFLKKNMANIWDIFQTDVRMPEEAQKSAFWLEGDLEQDKESCSF